MYNVVPHIRYAKYVLIHKAYVLYACCALGVPLWRALLHDASKFSRAEWGPYVRRFYGPNGYKPDANSKGYDHNRNRGQDPAFDAAWEHHWRNNPHHPEYWSKDRPTPEQMPDTYVREMVADWYGAGMAQGKPDIMAWYLAGVAHRNLHPETQFFAAYYLDTLQAKGIIP